MHKNFRSFIKSILSPFICLLICIGIVSCGGVVEYDQELVTTADGLPTWQDVENGVTDLPTPTPVEGSAPIFVSNPPAKVTEGELYRYAVSVVDIDVGDKVIVRADELPGWLELRNASTEPSLVGTPNQSDVGSHSITLTLVDLSGLESSQKFTIRVEGKSDSTPPVVVQNQKPVAYASQFTGQEDKVLPITLKAEDADSDNLSYTIVNQPKHGKLTGSFPNAQYTANANYSGNDSFVFRVNDGKISSNNATVSIVVTEVNDAPTVLNSSVKTDKNKAVRIVMSGDDIERQQLNYSVVANPKNGSLSNQSGNAITYTPKTNFSGNDSFVFRVNDGNLNSSTATVAISVSQANSAPIATNSSVNTNEDKAIRILMAATDADGQSLTYKIVANPKNGSLSNASTNAITYTPKANFSGNDSFLFQASDGTTNSSNATVAIKVNQVNDAPVAKNSSEATDRDKTIRLLMSANDVEGQTLNYSIVSNPKNGSLSNASANGITYTPKSGFVGTDSFTFRANDGSLNSNVATLSITVRNVAQPTTGTYRVIVDTDMGFDPDDIQSLYRLIHYSDILKVEGLISSRSTKTEVSVPKLQQWIRNVRVNELRAKGYTELMTQEELLSTVRLGTSTFGAPSPSRSTPGSKHIIDSVNSAISRGDKRPLYILTWGSLTTVAQALHDSPAIAPHIRIYSIGGPNVAVDTASRSYVYSFLNLRYKNLWWIENGSPIGQNRNSYVGVYTGGNQSGEWSNRNFINVNIRGHGQAGNDFPVATPLLKEGDSPSMLYLLSPIIGGVGNVNVPTSESWGGKFMRPNAATPNYYVDCCSNTEEARQTISKWRVQYLSHWKARWDRYK